jgi:hypothetical protein
VKLLGYTSSSEEEEHQICVFSMYLFLSGMPVMVEFLLLSPLLK